MTKADTLEFINPLLKSAVVDEFISFTIKEWDEENGTVIERIREKEWGDRLIARSSAVEEDTPGGTHAGMYRSVLNISPGDVNQIVSAVKSVIKSYRERGNFNPDNQIMIQNQVVDVKLSGVAFTKDPRTDAPYYIIEYDDHSGQTDQVTGSGKRKHLCVFRLVKTVPVNDKKKWNYILKALKEIEAIFPDKTLDIEFAIDKEDKIHIFQVREFRCPNSLKCNEGDILKTLDDTSRVYLNYSSMGDIIYSDMSDWNPAEMLGTKPAPLDISLYRYLITKDTWSKARADLGYTDLSKEELMVVFAGKPYIDAFVSLKSFTPNSLPGYIKERLVKYQLRKLRQNPQLHDKIEFEIAFTCADIISPRRTSDLKNDGFSLKEIGIIDDALIDLTKKIIEGIPSCIASSKELLEKLEIERRINQAGNFGAKEVCTLLLKIKQLLQKCRDYGVYSFSKLARLAFVGNYLMRQLLVSNIISEKEYEAYYASINTTASIIKNDRIALKRGKISEKDFLVKYGHLRPGTYDITSLRYDHMPQLILGEIGAVSIEEAGKTIIWNQKSLAKIGKTLKEASLNLPPDFFLDAVKEVIEWREKSKFEFTRTLSDAIELIAAVGELLGFSRAEMADLDIHTLIDPANIKPGIEKFQTLLKSNINESRERQNLYHCILLPPLLLAKEDFFFFESFESKPNYVTNQQVEAPIVTIEKEFLQGLLNLEGRIVLIESADPGYDWIFLGKIAGLVTKYGGIGSHMAVRCQELNIPAAIGCGDVLFERIKKAKMICIDAGEEKISIIN